MDQQQETPASPVECVVTINVPFRFLLGLLSPSEETANRLILLHRDIALIDRKLNQLLRGEENIMATEADLKNVLTRIDVATTQQSGVLATEAGTLKTISNELDTLIAKSKDTISPELLSAFQALADKTDAVSATIQTNADFSAALATKGAGDPVPLPVPETTVFVPAA
jgi:ABC-type transporter Mla subunit MlaD